MPSPLRLVDGYPGAWAQNPLLRTGLDLFGLGPNDRDNDGLESQPSVQSG